MEMTEGETQRHCSCHCGGVKFTARLPADLAGIRCNCSICAAKGAVMVGLPIDALEVTQGQGLLRTYQFNTGAAKHHFCSICGIHCFHQRRAAPDQFAINAVCIEGVDIYADFADLPVADGVNHPKDNGGKSRLAGRLRFTASQD